MRSWLLGFLLAACKYSAPQGQPPGDGMMPGDGSDAIGSDGDGSVVPDDARMAFDAPTLPSAGCFGTFVTVCLPVIPPAGDLAIDALTIDTDNAADCDPVAVGTDVDACVRAADRIFINGTLVAHGSRPLILISTRSDGQIVINGAGLIDVSSHRVGTTVTRGAGSNPATCSVGDPNDAGGGAGGTFGGKGGDGGNGMGGAGGTASNVAAVAKLVGGCPGGAGGNDGGAGGNGGGAVDLISPNIILNGDIKASGSGAFGGAAAGRGGGGGGSGGFIVFDSTNLTFNSCQLTAQGAGGGQGAGGNPGGNGNDPTTVGVAASGGSGGGSGGNGGNGATTGNGGAGGTNGGAGGGGGGGGTGRIHSHTTTTAGTAEAAPNVVAL